MTRKLDLSLFPGPVIDAPGDTFVIPLASDERPLRGDAGWLDWRVCGRISQQLRSGYATGDNGEALLLPAGPPFGSARILVVGAGPAAQIAGRPLLRAMRAAAEKLIALRSRVAVLATPASVDFADAATPILRGLIHALAHDPDAGDLHVVIPGGNQREKCLLSALSDVVPGAHGWGVSIDVAWVEPDSAA